jgi:hypothetical protein
VTGDDEGDSTVHKGYVSFPYFKCGIFVLMLRNAGVVVIEHRPICIPWQFMHAVTLVL